MLIFDKHCSRDTQVAAGRSSLTDLGFNDNRFSGPIPGAVAAWSSLRIDTGSQTDSNLAKCRVF